MTRARIYLPGVKSSDDALKPVTDLGSVKEVRDGFTLPIGSKFEDVYQVEFEGGNTCPKKYQKGKQKGKVKTNPFDELNQFRVFPEKGKALIFATAYRQSEVERQALIDIFGGYEHLVGIYEGKHPINQATQRTDGTVIIAESEDLGKVIEAIEKLGHEPISVARETQIFPPSA